MLHWKLKKCTHCGGDLFIDRDVDGWFEQCLQCSHTRLLKVFNKQLVPVSVETAAVEDWSKVKEW